MPDAISSQRPPAHGCLPFLLHSSFLWCPLHRILQLPASPAVSPSSSPASVPFQKKGLLPIPKLFSPNAILPLLTTSPAFPLLPLLLFSNDITTGGVLEEGREEEREEGLFPLLTCVVVSTSSGSCCQLQGRLRKAIYIYFSFDVIPRKEKFQKGYMDKFQVPENNINARKLLIPWVVSKVLKKIPRGQFMSVHGYFDQNGFSGHTDTDRL